MPRIRSVKPEFWTDERLVACTPLARLLYIGLNTYCDDYGRIVYSAVRLKLQILPAETSPIEPLLDELRKHDCILFYTESRRIPPNVPIPADEAVFIQISRFESEQKVDKRGASKTPAPPNPSDSLLIPAPERKGEERSGEDRKGDTSANADVGKPTVPPCPHHEIIDLYHELLPMGTEVNKKLWGGARQRHMTARWRELPERQTLDFWRRFFAHCAESKFLTGQAMPQPGRDPFRVSLGWLIEPKNFVKVHEGEYNR